MPALSVAPPRQPKKESSQRPKSRNIVDVEKLKISNKQQEPGVDKKNVQFLFGLLEQASNEREQLLKQLAEKDETIDMISQQRNLEEKSFRKVLTTERKKFDKKILDARNMLRRREDLLRAWSAVGSTIGMKSEEESEDRSQISAMLKRTCKFVPDSINDNQKAFFNIDHQANDNDEEDHPHDENEHDEDNENDEGDENENDNQGMDETSVGGHTQSESILMGDSRAKDSKQNKPKSSGDNTLNMGSVVLQDDEHPNENKDVKCISIGEMAAMNASKDINHEGSLQFQTMSNVSVHDNSGVNESPSRSKKVTSASLMSSSSYHAKNHSSSVDDVNRKKKGSTSGKKLESASVDLSDTPSKKYWWDHLVDDSSDDKIKDSNASGSLVLGSKLDKREGAPTEKSKKVTEGEDEDDDEKEACVDGEDSIMSLCSEDFKFSTQSS